MPAKRSAKVHKFHETAGDDQLPVFSILIEKEGEGMFGRIDVELLVQKAPKACEFFLQSCSGASNGEKKGAKRVSYRHNHFLRLTNVGLQVGDRSGIRTSSALDVENEIGRVSHGMGVISLCRSSSLLDESFFFCLTNDRAELESLDKRHAAFGRVVGGMDTLFAIHDDLLPYVKEGCVIEGSPYTISGIFPKTNT
ncbi:Cyclophilin-type peptidyl-prolyl cis-trans isomerase domain [Trypanosoma melophagium]|uniref:Cyclophilin-type peptidyl-prolyl cis-trans isomerase domain n=1 Tax=Trypanosoma melophagium TaxID=715481 RepID=UPI003519E2FE|nr:Cyclophilin-type peptidyl-prolyl cis-trans isomerase domain [Trypanosoma melophagium]